MLFIIISVGAGCWELVASSTYTRFLVNEMLAALFVARHI